MLKILILISLSSMATVSLAKENLRIVQDGSVARCSDLSSVGHRAYRLTEVSSSATQINFKLETLQCVLNSTETAMVLVPYALAAPIIYKYQNQTMSYEMNSTYLSVTNTDLTRELFQIPIDSRASVQTVTIDRNSLTEKSVDITVMGIQLVKKNNQFFDQGLIYGGHFRLVK